MRGIPVGGLVLLALASVGRAAGASEPLLATLELSAAADRAVGADGLTAPVSGRLESVTEHAIRLITQDGPAEISTSGVRRLDVAPRDVGSDAAGRVAVGPEGELVEVRFVGGGGLEGERFVWQGDTAMLSRAGREATFPIELVELVSWSSQGRPLPAGPPAPSWLETLPERPDGDVVVVRRGEGFECVECAMVEVNDEHVIVMLDGERIPVRRDRVAGLRWLRPTEPPVVGRVDVRMAGGRVPAATVGWSAERLVIDGRLLLPPEWLRSIDYAAGRSVRLSTLEPERVEVQPLLEGTADSPRLAAFFAPRRVRFSADLADDSLLVRPRTAMVWRVPPDSRVFRARAVAGGGRTSLVIGVDDREPLRRILAATPGTPVECPIEIEVAGGRRLSIVIDLPEDIGGETASGGLGGPVRFDRAVFEP